jgi:hypothetical protein
VEEQSASALRQGAQDMPLQRQLVWIRRLIWAGAIVMVGLTALSFEAVNVLPRGAGWLGFAVFVLLIEVQTRAKAAATGATPRYLGIAVATLSFGVMVGGSLALHHHEVT